MKVLQTLAWAALVALPACGGGGGDDDDGVQPPQFSISLTTSSSAVTLPVGGSVEITLLLARGGNYGGTVSFTAEGLPPYVQATFDPPSIGGNATQATMRLSASGDADEGAYSITVRASGSEVNDARTTLNCSLQLIPDFLISTPFPTLAVERGSAVQTVVALDRRGEFSGAVTFTLEGAPIGVTGSFAPNPVSGTASNLTITVGSSVAAASYAMTIRGRATGLADRSIPLTLEVSATGGYSLSIAPTTVTLLAPGTATATVTVNRTGGFATPVSLWPENFPTGVSTSGSQNPVTGNSSVYTFTASAQVVPGTYAMSIRGEAAGQPERRITFQLVIQQAPGFSISPLSSLVTVLAGGPSQTVTYSISRSAGFTGSVAFTIGGLPAGLTASFSPASTTGTQTQLAISAAPGTAAQSFPATVHATAAGFSQQVATVVVNVVTATKDIVWRFCGSNPQPVFFAYQDGTSAFVAVPAAGDGSFTTRFATNRGAVAFVQPGFEPPVADKRRPRFSMPNARQAAVTAATGYTMHVYYGNAVETHYGANEELPAAAAAQCQSAQVLKTLHGSVANVSDDEGFGVIMGTAVALGLPGDPRTFTLSDVLDGARDLVAARLAITEGGMDAMLTPTKLIARRGINPPNGSTLPLLDFASSEAFDPVNAPLTLSGLDGAQAEVSSLFATANGTYSPISVDVIAGNATRSYYGLPESRLIAGDLHGILASDNRNREVLAFRRNVAPWTVAFGPTIPPPPVDVYATSPVLRMRAQIAVGRPTTEYGGLLEVSFVQPNAQRAILMHFSPEALAISPNYELRTPVLTGLQGWNESLYGLQRGSLLQWMLEAYSASEFVQMDGAVLRAVRYSGALTP